MITCHWMSPAAAAGDIQWQVIIGPHWSGEPIIVQIDYGNMTFTDIDDEGNYFTAVPAAATDVVVGDATAFVTRGNAQVFAKALFQRMTIDDPNGDQIVNVDETECQEYLVPLYRYNDFSSYYGPLLPYNVKIGGGMMWETDWMVPLPLDPATGTPTPGWYSVTYDDMLTHTCAGPMFPGRVPGRVGYPPIGHAGGWWGPGTLTFEVK